MLYCIVLETLVLFASSINIYTIVSKKRLEKIRNICLIIIGLVLLASIVIDTTETLKWFYEQTNFRLIFIISNILYVFTNYIIYKNKK